MHTDEAEDSSNENLSKNQQILWFAKVLSQAPANQYFTHGDKILASSYPIRSRRYSRLGWNQHFQQCYLPEELSLLNQIKDRYQFLNSPHDEIIKYFDITEHTKWFELWQCQTPRYYPDHFHENDIFTLPNREAKDSSVYPLWDFGDNLARQIANWQGERVKDQLPALMNDPMMLVFDELKNWSFQTLTESSCQAETLATLVKRQSYLKNVLHIMPNFGLDRLHLYETINRLDDAANTVVNCMANKQLPELLSDVIIKSKSLETTIGTYLHFLLINENVANNYSPDFMTPNSESTYLSPIWKIYQNIFTTKYSESGLQPYMDFNRFYDLSENTESNNIRLKLNMDLLKNVRFASFVTQADKAQYLEAIALLESLTNVRKTFEDFKQIQMHLGTYLFASAYLDQMQLFVNNFVRLISSAQHVIDNLLNCANKGFHDELKNVKQTSQNLYFASNLKTLDTRFAQQTTTHTQLDDYCRKTKESIKIYQDEMTKLANHVKTGQAKATVNAAMQQLINQMNVINQYVPAQIDKKNIFSKTHSNELVLNQMTENNNDMCYPSEYDEMNDKANEVRWDRRITYDRYTRQPIYKVYAYSQSQEVGSLQLYGQPFFCISPDRNQHNILQAQGVFKDLVAELDYSDEALVIPDCQTLPPSLYDKLFFSSKNALVHGSLRGSSNVLGMVLRNLGVKESSAYVMSEFCYYSSIFSLNLYEQPNDSEEALNIFDNIYRALYATGQVFLFNSTVNLLSHFIARTANYCDENSLTFLSAGLRKMKTVMRFGIFAQSAIEGGLPETAAAIISGTLAQTAIEEVGYYLTKK